MPIESDHNHGNSNQYNHGTAVGYLKKHVVHYKLTVDKSTNKTNSYKQQSC